MGGITVDDFTSSVAYREIFGLGRQEGRQAEAAVLTVRQLQRRCGNLSPEQQARIQGLPLGELKPWPMPCSTSRDQKTSMPG